MAPTLTEQLGTITAIVALALGMVQVLKMLLVKYKVGIVNSLPTPLICVGVSMGLTVLASLVLKTLPGDIFDLLWQAALAAGAASGFFSWAKEPMDSPENKSKTIRLIIPFLLPLVLMGGCSGEMSNGQKYILTCQTYATTADTVATLVRAGEFGAADKVKIRALNDTCKALILKMRDDLVGGTTPFTFEYTLRQFQTVLDELLRLQLQAEVVLPVKEIANGPDNANPDWLNGGPEYRFVAGEGRGGVAEHGAGADPSRNRRGNADGPGGAREPRRRPEWRVAHPSPAIAYGAAEIEFD